METISQKIVNLAPLIETFRVIHNKGSLTAAANELKLGKSVVSKRLTQLETTLNVPLFERTTRRLFLTGAGHKLLRHAEMLHHEFHATFEDIEQWQHEPSGELRITVANILSKDAVCICSAFQKLYPNVVIIIDADDYKIDLTARRYDIGLRYGWTDNEVLIAKRFVKNAQPVIVIRSDQLEHPLTTFSELSDLPWAVPDPKHIVDFRKWVLIHKDGRKANLSYEPAFICHQSHQIKEMLYQGAGIVIWPRKDIKEDIESGLLTELLVDWEMPCHEIYAMYPSASSLSRNAQLWLTVATSYYKT